MRASSSGRAVDGAAGPPRDPAPAQGRAESRPFGGVACTTEAGPDPSVPEPFGAGWLSEIVESVAPTDASVLIRGETGVGKEVVARELHQRSARHQRAFVTVNCAALPIELLESELFGYERGAFTGAHREKPGKFELAHRGTVFLDEIGDTPLPLQATLLQVLRDGTFLRQGSPRDIRVDVRIIAATNRDLDQAVRDGRFREDLFNGLNVVTIRVPPLRERRKDIPHLAAHFLQHYAQQYGRPCPRVAAETMGHVLDYPWPGNVRELENTMKRIVVLGDDGWVTRDLVRLTSGPPPGRAAPLRAVAGAAEPRALGPPEAHAGPAEGLKTIARRAAVEAERAVLKSVLDQVHWNRLEASRRLKISYKTLRWKIRQCGLED
jgi:two-component system response regulator AtoC